MAEELVWRGRSSQLKNIGIFATCTLCAIAILGATFALSRTSWWQIAPFIPLSLIFIFITALGYYLRTKAKVYELTTERLKVTEGIFSKVTNTLELYRVKDLETRQPLSARIFGLENVQLNTSDTNTPTVVIDAVPSSVGLGDKVRNNVEAVRMLKRVREIDIE